jgi:hypothetical protein
MNPSHERDRLEAAVRVLRKTGDRQAVVHPPAVDAVEVLAQVAAGERSARAERVVARGIVVDMVHAEQERVDRGPAGAERGHFEDGISHG